MSVLDTMVAIVESEDLEKWEVAFNRLVDDWERNRAAGTRAAVNTYSTLSHRPSGISMHGKLVLGSLRLRGNSVRDWYGVVTMEAYISQLIVLLFRIMESSRTGRSRLGVAVRCLTAGFIVSSTWGHVVVLV